jgi:hypothetical protein
MPDTKIPTVPMTFAMRDGEWNSGRKRVTTSSAIAVVATAARRLRDRKLWTCILSMIGTFVIKTNSVRV